MIKKSLLALTMGAALLATGAAQAQMGSPMSGEGHAMHMQGQDYGPKQHKDRMAKRHQAHMDKLKQSLKLSKDQAGAWTTFETAMQAPNMAHPDHQAMAKMSTPERLDVMSKMKSEHDAQMQKRMDATRTFYATLSPEQKKTFDQETHQAMHQHDRGHKGQEKHAH